jgi:lipoate-protein ligase A
MELDAALLAAVAAGEPPGPLLRLYTFSPPGITIGRGRDPARELDLPLLEREGVAWSVRPTGGGAIWHEEAWTLAVAARLGPGGWAATPRRAYERTGELLRGALRRLGVPAARAEGAAGPAGAGPAACFASSAAGELVVEGRKLAGVAQRVAGGALLQQVNLLLGDAHARLARVVRAEPRARERLEQAWRAGAVGAARWLGPRASLESFARALLEELGGEPRGWRFHRGESHPVPLTPGPTPRRSA